MFKIISLVGLLPCLLFAAAPAPAAAVSGSNCAYAITKLQAQIKFEQGVKNTAPASAAAADALASNAKAEAFKAKGAVADAALSDAACRTAVIKGWTALHG